MAEIISNTAPLQYLHQVGLLHILPALTIRVIKTKQTGFGTRYEVEGDLAAPDGRSPRVCTVWQMDEGQEAPRLITAYPLEIVHDSRT